MSSLPRKSRPALLFGGMAFILLALTFWRPLQQRCLASFLLRSEAPSPEVLSTLVERVGNPAPLLLKLWRTQRIPHREFVISWLGTTSTTKPALAKALEPLLLEATADPDIATRASAFATLTRIKHPRLRLLARQQLSDPDPAARLIGLQSLRALATSNDVPVAVRLLDDPDPRVVVAAALLLRQAVGQDFGLKSTHALPQFTCIDTNPPPPPDLPAITQGVQRGHEWWTTHQVAFPTPPATPTPRTHTLGLPTSDFTLGDSAGKPVRLSQFRGKTVLLAFWSPGAPASLDDVPALNSLQQHAADLLTLLGICTPLPPSCCDDHEHGEGHEHAHHHHGESAATPAPPTVTSAVAQEAAARLQIRFPMLLDPEGKIALRYAANDFPTYVLIDAHGLIRRRLVGFRKESALAAMVEQVAASADHHGGAH